MLVAVRKASGNGHRGRVPSPSGSIKSHKKLDVSKSQNDTPTIVVRCNHCNSKLHDDDGCPYVKHLDYVILGSWRHSDVGLAYKNLDPIAPYIKEVR